VARLVASVFTVGIVGVYVNYVRYYKPDPNDHFTFWAAFLPWIAAYAFFLIVLAARKTEFPRPFQWLGRISYSVYLMHPLVLFAVDRWHRPWLSMAMLMVVTLVLSDLTFRVVERPFHELGRRRRPAPVAAV
jgi:peptidoglycan/LPS O-acetylase OafA/YrhL